MDSKKLAEFEFLLPTIAEQQEIVQRIETAFSWIDRIVVEHDRAAHLLPKLDQALLAQAFRGELLPQNPNDEPASALLERLQGERQTHTRRHRRALT